ncbi:MAG: transaldolase family protein [Pseudothermotoga sp.]
MKIYVDGCSDEALLFAEEIGIGVTTNPSIIARECTSKTLSEVIDRLSGLNVPSIFFQLEHFDEQLLRRLDPNKFVIKVAWIAEKYNLFTCLRKKGFRVCATAVYEISQLVFALNYDVDYVAFYYDRAMRRGIDSQRRIRQFKEIIANCKQDTKLIVASLKTASQANEAVIAGADEIALPFSVLREFVEVPEYVRKDVEKFSEDYKKLFSWEEDDGRISR